MYGFHWILLLQEHGYWGQGHKGDEEMTFWIKENVPDTKEG